MRVEQASEEGDKEQGDDTRANATERYATR
jgi:hypothetical protein